MSEVWLNKFHGLPVHATDGEIGHIDTFLFDDSDWNLRYVVVETGSWLFERKVLVSTASLDRDSLSRGVLNVFLTREQLRHSPDIDTDKPVSRQHEIELQSYYGWPSYWDEMGVTPIFPTGMTPMPAEGNPHLRDNNELTGYAVLASDGEVGAVEDFVLGADSWHLTSFVVGTGSWFSQKLLYVPLDWVRKASWEESGIFLDHSRSDAMACRAAN